MTVEAQQSDLAKAYTAAFAEMTNAVKDRKNPHLGNDYATLESVLDTVRPVLARHKLSVYQAPQDVTVLEPGVYLVSVLTSIIHESGQSMTVRTQVPVSPQLDKKTGLQKVDAQRLGSAITYARRYALAAVCGITQTDDDGEAASRKHDAVDDRALLDAVKEAATADALARLKDAVRSSGNRALIQAYVERANALKEDN